MMSSSSDIAVFPDHGRMRALCFSQLSSICRTGTLRIATLAEPLPTYRMHLRKWLLKNLHDLYGVAAFSSTQPRPATPQSPAQQGEAARHKSRCCAFSRGGGACGA